LDYAELSPVDLTLACLRDGEHDAWAEFIRRFNPLISAIAIRVARKWGESSPQVLDDLIQETYLKLCAERASLIQRFDPAYPKSIYGYIKIFTANVVHDHFRSLHTRKRGAQLTTDLSPALENVVESRSSSSSARSIERSILFDQIDRFLCRAETSPTAERDRRIFWLYYRVGLTSAAIAATAGVGLNTKGVESTILRLTRRVRAHLTMAAVTKKSALTVVSGEGKQAVESY